MQRTGAAERDHGVVAGIASALDRDEAQCVLHVGRRDQVHAPGRLLRGNAERVGDVALDAVAAPLATSSVMVPALNQSGEM